MQLRARVGRIQPDSKSIEDVIGRTRRTLALAQLGLSDLLESPDLTRQIAGIASVAVHGRAVTNVLQHLRTFDKEAFNEWYEPYEQQMMQDELLAYFYRLRTLILKDGAPRVWVTNSLEPRPQPLGGLGSTGALPGATEGYSTYYKSSYLEKAFLSKPERVYIPLPVKQNSDTVLLLPDVPTRHLGEVIMDVSAQGLCRLYVEYLGNLVRDTRSCQLVRV